MFRDSNGNFVERTVAYVKDIPGFIKKITDGRGVKSPQLILSSDAGQGIIKYITANFTIPTNKLI